MAGITGQAIHQIHEQREPTALPWNQLGERWRRQYNAIADVLNVTYINPLQGLVWEQSALLQECYEVIEAEYGTGPQILAQIKDVQERIKQLLSEERKEGK